MPVMIIPGSLHQLFAKAVQLRSGKTGDSGTSTPTSYPALVVALDATSASRVLSDNRTFTVANYYRKMNDVLGPFFLGLDYEDPRYKAQIAMWRETIRPDDPDRIYRCARDAARAEKLDSGADGAVDVVQWTARTLDRFVESYFGVLPIAARDGDGATAMLSLNQQTASYIFGLDLLAPPLQEKAKRAGSKIKRHLVEVIESKREAPENPGDSLLDRLLGGAAKDAEATLVSTVLAGTLSGLYVPTSNQFFSVVDYLIDLPPRNRDRFRAAARERASQPAPLPIEDDDLVARHVREASRFGPFPSGLFRHCPGGGRLESGNGRTKEIPEGATVLALTATVSLDPRLAPHPGVFLIGRTDDHYMLFGSGHHRCIGATADWPVATALMTEMATELFRLPGLRRARGRRGSIRKKNSWPDSFVLEYDRSASGESHR